MDKETNERFWIDNDPILDTEVLSHWHAIIDEEAGGFDVLANPNSIFFTPQFILKAVTLHTPLVELVEQLSEDVGHYVDCPYRHHGECTCIQNNILTILANAKGEI